MQFTWAAFSSVACPAVQYFSTLSHKRHNLKKKKKILNVQYVFWFPLQILSETFIILKGLQWHIIINVHRSSCIVLILIRVRWNLNFSINYRKLWNIKFLENPSGGSRVVPCGHTDRRSDRLSDRRMDMTKQIVAFRNFAKAPKTKPSIEALSWNFKIENFTEIWQPQSKNFTKICQTQSKNFTKICQPKSKNLTELCQPQSKNFNEICQPHSIFCQNRKNVWFLHKDRPDFVLSIREFCYFRDK